MNKRKKGIRLLKIALEYKLILRWIRLKRFFRASNRMSISEARKLERVLNKFSNYASEKKFNNLFKK